MTTRFDPKDPGETVTMEFDFARLGTPTNPNIEIAVHRGQDASANAVLSGSWVVSGTKVLQRAVGGVNGVDYAVRCYADIGAERFLIDAILPVRVSPRPA